MKWSNDLKWNKIKEIEGRLSLTYPNYDKDKYPLCYFQYKQDIWILANDIYDALTKDCQCEESEEYIDWSVVPMHWSKVLAWANELKGDYGSRSHIYKQAWLEEYWEDHEYANS